MFGKHKDQPVEEAADDGLRVAEIERLRTLPVVELAREIMSAFGADGAVGGEGILMEENVIQYLLASYPGKPKHPQELREPVLEGLQKLEHAELILMVPSVSMGAMFAVTRRGKKALAEGSVQRHLEETRSPSAVVS